MAHRAVGDLPAKLLHPPVRLVARAFGVTLEMDMVAPDGMLGVEAGARHAVDELLGNGVAHLLAAPPVIDHERIEAAGGLVRAVARVARRRHEDARLVLELHPPRARLEVFAELAVMRPQLRAEKVTFLDGRRKVGPEFVLRRLEVGEVNADALVGDEHGAEADEDEVAQGLAGGDGGIVNRLRAPPVEPQAGGLEVVHVPPEQDLRREDGVDEEGAEGGLGKLHPDA